LRRNFFDDKATDLLYLWDILEEHGLTQLTMQQLLEGAGSGMGVLVFRLSLEPNTTNMMTIHCRHRQKKAETMRRHYLHN
jgi:hypothetical protein